MRKITIPYLVFTSLYFVLALFTILMLVLTSCFDEFGQMFRLTTQPFGVYFDIGIVLLTCSVIVAIFNIVRIYISHLPKLYSVAIGVVLCGFLFLLYSEMFLLERVFLDIFSLEDSIALNNENIFYKNAYQIITDYLFYCFFILLPFIAYLINLSFDKSAIGKVLQLTQPSFNVMICALFGFAITPFFKSGMYGYVDLGLFCLGLYFVGHYCFKRYSSIDSYEYFNVFLLLVVFLVMLFGDFKFVNGESYFEVRKVFYILVLFGWSNSWMMKLTTKRKT
ncbi:hypothetical protein [Helicobacter turcicus]|uniref:Uncharacterized protein n=1 Tax=Helicobacter turcicus TaxID=2867412 RepID=A0ABS7JLG0_9HELI|nr:hypothetical protein [Helicobacter turcicus]MBX7490235.1 hypothetical protein [Helicobacter turcicus]MBX7545186.1 hypothetical protein [Helicobacter turcicus]